MPPSRPMEERFWEKVDRRGADDCWPWIAGKSTAGYGTFNLGHGKFDFAHRVAYRLHVGPIPAGMDLDHTCHDPESDCPGGNACAHRACCNPTHAKPATRAANVLRGLSPPARNARKECCPDCGRDYTTDRRGYRVCRRCPAREAVA